MSILKSLNEVANAIGRLISRILGFESKGIAATEDTSSGGGRDYQSEVLAWLRERFAEDIKQNFAGGHDPDGAPWKPLKWRRGRPLILTGLLMNSAYVAAQNVTLRNGTEIHATLSTPSYWMFHEYGTSRIPARPFFGPSKETVQGLADLMVSDMAQSAVDTVTK